MILLAAGVATFTLVHLFLSVRPEQVSALRSALGAGPMKGLVALGSAAGIALIVFGWKNSTPVMLYLPMTELRGLALALIIVGVCLFIASNRPTRIKQFIRHPQLTGVCAWSAGHLLLNGDSKSVLLFAGLGLWAVIEIVLINRRDGAWVKPQRPALSADLVTALLAAIGIAAVFYLHPWLAGVPAITLPQG
ncbi:MAG: NnrU family protein [Congregibacter sp.]